MPSLPYPLDRLRCAAAPRLLAAAIAMLSLGLAASQAPAQTGTRPNSAPAGQKQTAAAPAGNSVDAKLAEVKKQLAITPAQQPHFDRFADIVKQNAQAIEALVQTAQQTAQRDAVEGLRTAANFAQTEADNLKRLVPALESLYASLTDQQKRTADRIFNTPPAAAAPAPSQPQGKPRG
jgi:protein CpxP